MPHRGLVPRGARLAGLASEMADRLIAGRDVGSVATVIIGTAHGSMTETTGFLESMIRNDEANPMPRAFTTSVHNSIASRVALSLGARGACQTFVHGPVSWAHALFAASRVFAVGSTGPVIAGGLDEGSDYLARGLYASERLPNQSGSEGGALWLLARADLVTAPLAYVRDVRFCRSCDPVDWIRSVLADSPVEFLLVGDTRPHENSLSELTIALTTAARPARCYAPLVGAHPASGAAALALAAQMISGMSSTKATNSAMYHQDAITTRAAPKSIGVVTVSHLGDVAFAALDGAL